ARGIKAPVPFGTLASFTGVPFFGLDEMHLLGHGLGRMLWSFLVNEKEKFGSQSDDYPFSLKKGITLRNIGETVEKARQTIPTSFQGKWSNTATNTGHYRAVDWLDFLLYAVPTIVAENLVHDDTRTAIRNLVIACQISLQWECTDKEIKIIER
ncbi:hypothetical protein DFQ28_004336, partial [Apophysomyces sp. BC1034]